MSLNLNLPTAGQPTELLAERFNAWRKVIRSLNHYFTETATVQAEVVRQNVRLGNAVQFPFDDNAAAAKEKPNGRDKDKDLIAPDMFRQPGSGSVTDIPADLFAFHRAQAAAASKIVKELQHNVVPRLEDLRGDLLVKIKEIRALHNDFKNNVAKEQSETQRSADAYGQALGAIEQAGLAPSARQDPYVLKTQLDRQLARQVHEENYLLEAFLNLEQSGHQLEIAVVQEIQQALSTFARLAKTQGENTTTLLSDKLVQGFVDKSPDQEWNAFLNGNPHFVAQDTAYRKIEDVRYPGQDHVLSVKVRAGYLERRSKYLKSYSRAYYVLTPLYLHEYKSADHHKRDATPVMSLSLDECTLQPDKTGAAGGAKSGSHRFILNARNQHGGSGKGHNWVFRAESEAKLEEWLADLDALTAAKSLDQRLQLAKGYAKAPELNMSVNTDIPGSVLPASANTVADNDNLSPNQSKEPSSPVLSDTSGVASTDEPFAAVSDHSEHKTDESEPKTEDGQRPSRGRFPSEVKLQVPEPVSTTESDPSVPDLHTQPFVVPHEYTLSRQGDDASVFSYDLEHKTHSTLPEDVDFKPVDADVPIHVERRLTMTRHKDEDPLQFGTANVARIEGDPNPEEAVLQRVSSARRMSTGSRPSRRATGSFGTTDDLKPLTSAEPPLFFAGGLPATTGGRE